MENKKEFEQYQKNYAILLYEKFIKENNLQKDFEDFCMKEFQEEQNSFEDYIKEINRNETFI